MPRGGRRGGKPGQSYPNRSDLSVNKGPQPVGNFAGPNVPYGTGTELARSQNQMPVSSPPQAGPSAPPEPPPGLQALMGGAMPPGVPPGGHGDFTRPSERPLEPTTHGLPTGPGGGPEVMMNPTNDSARNLLKQLSNQPYVSDEIRNLLNSL